EVGVEPAAAAVIGEDIKTFGHAVRLPCSMEIHARGQVFSAQADYSRGDGFSEDFRMTAAEHEEKFRNFSDAELNADQIETAIGLLRQLPQQTSMEALVTALCRDDASLAARDGAKVLVGTGT